MVKADDDTYLHLPGFLGALSPDLLQGGGQGRQQPHRNVHEAAVQNKEEEEEEDSKQEGKDGGAAYSAGEATVELTTEFYAAMCARDTCMEALLYGQDDETQAAYNVLCDVSNQCGKDMLKGYFDTIPKELEESAIMDGASRFTVFTRIILPLAAPAIAVTALFSFMTAWNEFVLAFTFNNDPKMFTLPVTIQRYADPKSTYWGSFAAASIIVSVPVMALFYKLQKYIVSGLTAGAVKG